MIIPTWCMNLTFVDISGWLISDMQCVKRCQTWCIVSYLLIYVLMHHICLSLIKASLFNNFSGAADIYTSSKWICCGKPGRVGTCLRFDMSAAHLCLLRLFVCVFFLLSFINTVVATVNSINMLLHFGFGVSRNGIVGALGHVKSSSRRLLNFIWLSASSWS